MTNRNLIKFLKELEAKEKNFIQQLMIIKLKRSLVKKMLQKQKYVPC